MSNAPNNEISEALQRSEKAQAALVAARRRLTRSEEALAGARRDLAAAEEENKAASSSLETLITRNLKQLMKKGGQRTIQALGELLVKSGDDAGASPPQGELLTDPAPAPAPSPAPTPSPEATEA